MVTLLASLSSLVPRPSDGSIIEGCNGGRGALFLVFPATVDKQLFSSDLVWGPDYSRSTSLLCRSYLAHAREDEGRFRRYEIKAVKQELTHV